MNNGRICISVCAETVDEMITKIKQAEEFADVIEVRFDCPEKNNYQNLISELPEIKATYIFTFRPKDQGGKRELTIGERLKFWEYVFWAKKGGFIIDLECDPSILAALNPSKIERIVSFHNFASKEENLDSLWVTMSELANCTVKIAVQTHDAVDALPVWKLLDRAKAERKNIIPIAMGEAGKWTRILGLAHGSYLTYTSPAEGFETADGQFTARDTLETYRVKELDLNTRVFGVIGDPVSESLSPYMHNPAFAEQGINAVFIPLQVKNLDEFIHRMVRSETREVELNFGGFSVTMPHKQAIIKQLDVIDPTAEKIGAVNTVKIDGDKLIGYNTDAYGFLKPLQEKFGNLKDVRVAVFGAGGAARACVFALKQEKADVTVFARDIQKGKAFADEFGIQSKQLTADQRPLTTDVIVNATPLGMKGPLENESFFSAEQIEGVKFVYDLVTSQTDTPIIREAKKASIPSINGVEMLIYQGAKQFEIWTGYEAPIEQMRAAILKKINKI